MPTTVTFYRESLYRYSALSLLIVLERLEQEEDYEECAKIVEAMTLEEKEHKLPIGTRLTPEIVKEIVEYSQVPLASYVEYGRNLYNEIKVL